MQAQIDLIGQLSENGNLEELVKQVRGLQQHFGERKAQEFRDALNSPSAHNKFEETPLHACCYSGHLACVRFLLEVGADPTCTVSFVRSTPLHSAAAGGHVDIVRHLIEVQPIGKRSDYINITTSTGFTAARCALERSYFSIARVLVEWGARLDYPVAKGDYGTCEKLYDALWMESREAIGGPGPDTSRGPDIIQIGGVSIQIASDLHLEFYGDNPIPYKDIIVPGAPILALLGDIGLPIASDGHYERFLHHMADQFQLVLVVAGNHGT